LLSDAATLTGVVHPSASFMSFAYLRDCVLKDIDANVPSIAITTSKSFPYFL